MHATPKKRLCWNCEGNVSLADETCPYCGVSVIPASLESAPSPYVSAYSHENENKELEIPRSPYAPPEQKSEAVSLSHAETEDESEVPLNEFKNTLTALMLLLAGSVFFLFGLTLALFSQQGVFVLQWNGSYWFIYSLISIPLLFLGWRSLLKLGENS